MLSRIEVGNIHEKKDIQKKNNENNIKSKVWGIMREIKQQLTKRKLLSMSDVDLALRLKPEGAIHQLGFGE